MDVYGAGETTTSWNVALGIQAAVDNGATVLNLSLGGPSDSAVLDSVIQQAVAAGIPVYAAAGNQPVSTPTYPAADPGVIAVTATQGSQLAPYANFGSFVSLAMPGASVVYLGGQAYVVQGTSPATAYATGVAAGTKGAGCHALDANPDRHAAEISRAAMILGEEKQGWLAANSNEDRGTASCGLLQSPKQHLNAVVP